MNSTLGSVVPLAMFEYLRGHDKDNISRRQETTATTSIVETMDPELVKVKMGPKEGSV